MDGLREGAKLDRYIIGEVLGAGGMATVFRARHESLGTEVALKVLAGNFTQNATVRERFRQEGYVQANLHHPNIVHGSNANTSDRRRRGLTIRYIPTTTRIVSDGPWPSAFLLRGEAVEGVNEYLPKPRYREDAHMAFRGCEGWE